MKPLSIIHLSDTHLCPDGRLLHGFIDSWQRLDQVLEAAQAFAPDAIVITGDIADRGANIHDLAARKLNMFQAESGIPVISIPGNHDPVESIGRKFNALRLSTGPRSANTVHEVMGLRIIGLDSGGFQVSQGEIDQEQLTWLESLLEVPAPKGTLILLHHPPVEASSKERAGRGLRYPMALAAITTGSDVRAILCGHYHQAATSQLLNTPVFMAPAVSYNMNPFAPNEILADSSAGFAVLQVAQDSMNWTVASTDQFVASSERSSRPAPISGQRAAR